MFGEDALRCAFAGCNGILERLMKRGTYPGWGTYERRLCNKCDRKSEIAPSYFNKREIQNLNFDLKTKKDQLKNFF